MTFANTTQLFGLLMSDDGSLTLLSSSWKHEVKLPASTIAAFDLFNESRDGFSWEGDSELTSDLLEVACRVSGWYPVDKDRMNRAVLAVCEPGGPLERRPQQLLKLARC